MPTRRLTVSVPQPCPKPWHDMAPHGQGRFCGSCQKTVVDFTSMTDAEIIAWLEKSSGRVCGSFNRNQLNEGSPRSKPALSGWPWKAVTLALATWFSTEPTQASGKTPHGISNSFGLAVSHQSSFPENLLSDSLSVATGKVLDATTGEAIPGVTVLLKGTTIMAPTDKDGVFVLGFPADMAIDKQVVVFSFIGYTNQEIPLKDFLEHPKKTIRLTIDNRAIGEVVIIRSDSPKREYKSPPPASKKASLFQKIKNLFR